MSQDIDIGQLDVKTLFRKNGTVYERGNLTWDVPPPMRPALKKIYLETPYALIDCGNGYFIECYGSRGQRDNGYCDVALVVKDRKGRIILAPRKIWDEMLHGVVLVAAGDDMEARYAAGTNTYRLKMLVERAAALPAHWNAGIKFHSSSMSDYFLQQGAYFKLRRPAAKADQPQL